MPLILEWGRRGTNACTWFIYHFDQMTSRAWKANVSNACTARNTDLRICISYIHNINR